MNRKEHEMARLFADHRHKLEWCRVRDLKVDQAYQRGRKEHLIKAICADFNPDAFASLFVARRQGVLFVMDGQQRLTALIRMGWENQRVPCLVVEDTTQAYEAGIFRKSNEDRTAVLPLESFRAALVEGSPTHQKLKNLVEQAGFSIPLDNAKPGTRRPGSIGCVGLLLNIYREGQGKQALLDVLGVVRYAWMNDAQGTSPDLLGGLYSFLMRYSNLVVLDRLKANLKYLPAGVVVAEGSARGELMRATRRSGVASRLRDAYNLGLRSGQLPEWEFGAKHAPETWKGVRSTSETKPPVALAVRVYVSRLPVKATFTSNQVRKWTMATYAGWAKSLAISAVVSALNRLKTEGLVQGHIERKGRKGSAAVYWRTDTVMAPGVETQQ